MRKIGRTRCRARPAGFQVLVITDLPPARTHNSVVREGCAFVRPVHPARAEKRPQQAGFLTSGSSRLSPPSRAEAQWHDGDALPVTVAGAVPDWVACGHRPDFPIKPFRAPVAKDWISQAIDLRKYSHLQQQKHVATCSAATGSPRGDQKGTGCKTPAAPATVSGEPTGQLRHWDLTVLRRRPDRH